MNFTISHLSVIGHKMKVIIGLWILISEQPYTSSFLTTSSHFSHFAWPIGQFSKSFGKFVWRLHLVHVQKAALLALNHQKTLTHIYNQGDCALGACICVHRAVMKAITPNYPQRSSVRRPAEVLSRSLKLFTVSTDQYWVNSITMSESFSVLRT